MPWWLLLMTIVTFLFVVPVVIAPTHWVAHWFASTDLVRIIDPLFTLPLNFFIYAGAPRKNYRAIEWACFMIAAAIYVEGHGIHLTANMLKRPVEDFNTNHPNVTSQYPVLIDIFNYCEKTWEHVVGHYLYAFGAILLSFNQAWVHRTIRNRNLSKIELVAFGFASLMYGINIAGVAIEFPSGLIVGLVFLGVYAIPLGVYTYKTGDLFSKGRRVVLQFFLIGYALSLIFILIYIAVVGGLKDRKSAGY